MAQFKYAVSYLFLAIYVFLWIFVCSKVWSYDPKAGDPASVPLDAQLVAWVGLFSTTLATAVGALLGIKIGQDGNNGLDALVPGNAGLNKWWNKLKFIAKRLLAMKWLTGVTIGVYIVVGLVIGGTALFSGHEPELVASYATSVVSLIVAVFAATVAPAPD